MKGGVTLDDVLLQQIESNSDPTLTTLDINGNSGNKIGDAGAEDLANALKANTTLTTLILSGNDIGIAGAKALANALIENKNTKLTTLILSGNEFGVEGAKDLADALKVNTTLTTLDINNKYSNYNNTNTSYDYSTLFDSIKLLIESINNKLKINKQRTVNLNYNITTFNV